MFRQVNGCQLNSFATNIRNSSGSILVSTINGSIEILDQNTFAKKASFELERDCIVTNIKASAINQSIVYASYKSGIVCTWDTRSQGLKPNGAFNYNAPINSFDLDNNENLACCGTDLVSEDSHVLLWDPRNAASVIADFNECHSDDVTAIRFNQHFPNKLLTGSTDGLVCTYDLNEGWDQNETMNGVIKCDSVANVGYFGPSSEYIYATSHMETFSIHHATDGSDIRRFGDVRTNEGIEYLIDVTYDSSSEMLLLLAGNRMGGVGLFDVNLDGLRLCFELVGGHSDMIRAIDIGSDGSILSGGEEGNLIQWRR